jgi:hypothetical protein
VSNALDLFRAQQAAVEQVLDRLNDVAGMLTRLNDQATQLSHDRELRQLLQEERTWLDTAHRLVNETRRWREEDARRYWPGLIYRWIAAALLALASVTSRPSVTRVSRNPLLKNSKGCVNAPSSGSWSRIE